MIERASAIIGVCVGGGMVGKFLLFNVFCKLLWLQQILLRDGYNPLVDHLNQVDPYRNCSEPVLPRSSMEMNVQMSNTK